MTLTNLQPSQTVLDAVENVEAAGNEPGVITLSNGVVLKIKAVSKEAYLDVLARFEEPRPPIALTQKGRKEANPNDPEYKRQLQQYRVNLARGITLAVYAMGVELISVPDGVRGPFDEDWLEELRLSGLASGTSERAMVMDWLRHYAAKSTLDNQAIMLAAGRMLGTPEQDVQEATKSI